MELDARPHLLTDMPVEPTAGEDNDGDYAWESYRVDLRRFVARQLHNRQEAEDVLQDIFCKVLRYPSQEALQNPRAWLWRIAWQVLNLARKRERDHRRHQIAADPDVLESLANQSQYGVTASAEADVEAADELRAAFDELPPATQLAFLRSRRDGWSNDQIAAELGVTTSMVKKHIIRAVAHFSTYFSTKESTSAGKESR